MLPNSTHSKGAICALFSALSFGTMGFLVHYGGGTFPHQEVAFFRGLVNWLLVSPFVIRKVPLLFRSNAKYIWLRSLAGACSVLCIFWTMQNTTYGNAKALADLSPIFVVLLSHLCLREPMSKSESIGVALAIAGAISLQTYSQSTITATAIAIGILGSFFASIAYVSLRAAAVKFSPLLVVWSFSLFTMLASAAWPSVHKWRSPHSSELLYLLAIGVSGSLGQVFLTNAYVYLKAPIVSALGLSSLLCGITLEYFFHPQHIPSSTAWSSYSLIFFGILTIQLQPLWKRALTKSFRTESTPTSPQI